ncbi:MAG: tetratricopeptide repeat protein [Acidobacteria bacterium]|nr:tetratricopeptide repeat protein [Acidobacteriota bacterium]
MRFGLAAGLLVLAAGLVPAAPAAAQSREQRQMMADLRILQEQTAVMQNLIAQLGDALKAISQRLDDQTSATRRAFADQKLIIDTLSTDLRVVREKVDDNNVRIGSLTAEIESVRRTVAALTAPPAVTTAEGTAAASAPGAAPPAADQSAAVPAPAATPALGTSPQRAWDTAFSDYVGGQYDLAVLGFEAYIRDFPKSDQADNAQLLIGKALILDNQYDKAVEALDTLIRNYPDGDTVAEAYYQKGISLQHLGEVDKAREALSTTVKNYPDSDAALLARQKLTALAKPE